MKSSSVTIQMKAVEQYCTFLWYCYVLRYNVVVMFEPVNVILKCGH